MVDLQRVLERYRLFRLIVSLVGAAGLVYLGIYLPIKYTAGKDTAISIVYQAIVDISSPNIAAWVATLFFLFLWLKERRVRKSSIKREHDRILEFEREKDLNRSSSKLEE